MARHDRKVMTVLMNNPKLIETAPRLSLPQEPYKACRTPSFKIATVLEINLPRSILSVA